MKYILIAAASLLVFSNGYAQSRQNTKKQEAAISQYLNMKNSLIISDQANTTKGADSLVKSLIKVKNADSIRHYATLIATAPNMNEQRKSFKSLSTFMWEMTKQIKGQQSPLYLQVCPMTGASWLSKEKEIRNPYYPKNMLTCGEVKDQI